MSKLRVGLTAILITCALMYAATAFAQTPLDVTQGGYYTAYPTYSDRSCGHVYLSVEQYDGTRAMVRATTTCAGSGRGSKSRTWLYCTEVTTPDGYSIVVGDRVFVTSWLYGQAGAVCPGL